MNFDSLEAFIHMGGHGLYVWLSYGVGFLVFAIALLSPLIKHKNIKKDLLQLKRRQQRILSTKDQDIGIH